MEQNTEEVTEKKMNFFSRIFLKIVNSIPTNNKDWVIVISVILLFGIWILDLFIVDPIPLIDEIALPIITAYISKWYIDRKNKGKKQPPTPV